MKLLVKSPTKKLLSKIEKYLLFHRLSAREFGVICSNDTNLIYSLRRGREMRFSTLLKIEKFLNKKTNKSKRKGGRNVRSNGSRRKVHKR